MNLDELCPYRSLLLCTCPDRWSMPEAVQELRQQAEKLETVVHVEEASPIAVRHGLRVAHFYYRQERSPTWLLTQEVQDQFNELVVLFRKAKYIAILATESRLRNQIRTMLNTADGTQIGHLQPMTAASLNGAFVRGKTNALWLSGTHRQVASRVDNKAISGADLLYALDPLGDQTFFFTAAVTTLPQKAYAHKVGAAPRRAYIWAGPSRDGEDLCAGVSTLLDLIRDAPSPIENPFPILAAPAVDANALQSVADAYEAALVPSELLAYDLADDVREVAEKWSRLEFDVSPKGGLDFDATLSLSDAAGNHVLLGDVRLAFDYTHPERIVWRASSLGGSAAAPGMLDEAVAVLNSRRTWLKVWYESGHTLAEQTMFKMRFRDALFDYCFADFGGFDVTKEKPNPLTALTIGAQNSLFCWIRQRWHHAIPQQGVISGWLACNDGSMEIADFIHFDQVNGRAELTLIHAKGSKSAAADRQLSVTDYELVVGQAVKNLRFLDLKNSADAFTDFLSEKLMNAAWEAGNASTRSAMLSAMRAGGAAPLRRVVVVQPRCTRSALTAARAANASAKQAMISKQLDTLLLAASANCHNLGAEFVVVADDV